MGWNCPREDNGFHVTLFLPEHPELENNGVAPCKEDLGQGESGTPDKER